MDTIGKIKLAIYNADNSESKITEECFTIGGYTTPKVRFLMNNLGAISNNYLEVGTHRGALFIATGYKNQDLKLTAIDNFSELAGEGGVREEFISNCEKFIDNYILIEQDCFTVRENQFQNKIDLYLYDGSHSLKSHKKALTYFKEILSDEFILVVDDFNWERVRQGTIEGIYGSKMEILFQKQLGASNGEYHNGIFVALIKNKK